MTRDGSQLSAAKRAYRSASAEGNRQEEARWANVIGDILKNRGEYVEALKWLRIDYEISVKYLPEKHLLPTCQSLGEVYLRLEYFKDALIYQKKHLELAKDSNDLIEQQRASTQLGRTYHEMFLLSNDDHYSVRNAKKYFKAAMKLAQALKENPLPNTSFLKEFIDAHNNVGMLEMDLDNLEEAKKILTKGLEICDEEEVIEDDDGRSRLHHNLGNVFMELRMWDKAREHIEEDIIICKRIGHRQGEAKGYINLGELHYKVQKYEEAILCYKKALDLAKSLEDEDTLAGQIDQNIETVKEAIKVMAELKNEEQNLKKLSRNMIMARGKPGERKCLLQQNASVDRLIEKSSMVFAWLKHREFAKRKKRIASELCDKEKLSDSYLVIGESYQKLRNFRKALKWYKKGWEAYKSIGNLEGQALVKINIGDVLDSDGNWAGALDAFEEGYRIAVEANLPSVQVSALENMHYSHMIRFDNVEEARRLQNLIDNLNQSKIRDVEAQKVMEDWCSETDTEESLPDVEELKDDVPLISLLQSGKLFPTLKNAQIEKQNATNEPLDASSKSLSKSASDQQTGVGRKRIRVVISDDEGEMHDEAGCSQGKFKKCLLEDVATSNEYKNRKEASSPCEFQDVSAVPSKSAFSLCTAVILEESTCSYKSNSSNVASQSGGDLQPLNTVKIVPGSNIPGSKYADNLLHEHSSGGLKLNTSHGEHGQHIMFKLDDQLIHMETSSFMIVDELNIDSLKIEVACLYYLQLPMEKRTKGLLPIIQHMTCDGRALESLEDLKALKNQFGKAWVEVFIDGWVQKRLMKLYVDCCEELSEKPNMKLLKKLYNLEVSEDEVIASECELQDISIAPLLNALHAHKTLAMLNLSHNSLGNGTMEKLQQVLMSSSQKYGGLTLDLHCNRFGPIALFQICECSVLFARLEVLNISGNRLTDACGSYLSTILEKCKALYSLNMERCSITSRTVQRVADSLDPGSVLAQLWLGHNHPMSGNAIISLLAKLATLKRFSELNLNGLKLSKPAVDSLCLLAKSCCLSGLMLGSTSIGTDGALQLTESLSGGAQEYAKLDLSYCELTSQYIVKLNADFPLAGGIIELNLGGNPIMQEGGTALASLLKSPWCYVQVLVLNKCQLGLAGILLVMQALAENNSLEELYLAENVDMDKGYTSKGMTNGCTESLRPSHNASNICATSTNCDRLEIADSEDELIREEEPPAAAALSGFDDSCTSSCQRDPSPQFLQELSTAIGMTRLLKSLDLSNNGFSTQVAETLYNAWSSSFRAGMAQRHIKEETVHFSVQGIRCCKVKPCCRPRD
ncbi:protein TONSOKU isoform X2 [Malania oleifera]|uniref:protein TONSOKU isoform X2 n=1 Tax=Malania oleifera TaxID=397392 RepID=UPI0025ADE794|nr:protein TONSOKU isoform X2 [Malania oleifera]